MHEAFPEAVVSFPENLLLALPCIPDPGDRHVVAAAIHSHAHAIVTANLKHFPKEALAQYNIMVHSPDDFMVNQFHLNSDRIPEVLDTQASAIGKARSYILERLEPQLPEFVKLVRKGF